LPVGVGGDAYREHEVRVRPGDRLVVYSDGVTAARSQDGEHFGNGRLLTELEQTRGAPLEQAVNALVKAVEAWRGGNPRQDDVAIVALEVEEAAAASA
jgi:serine phosphatase RsbU (regulator of sigma subunit)